ncbi:hypothetical protein BDP55DRAFT_8831 [Colletotrichum godetiae]|uniref:C2H2-type domain-containing protein n=1 Tax=Colletotrichum godetiae TaxID=1209918 RepID=A0AAJ0B0A6_9PEZI|nr:uncharacterized protein BDP55DRAFT_8831 [Colletotrichum godetiae]KAK1701068.1 hypothetical protein BDP55DRAFT_8831 [Colletotrichum godetiae]
MIGGFASREHLYRHHEQKAHCLRCGKVFDNQADSAKHAQLDEPCNLVKDFFIEGFNKDQLKKLKSRKRARGDRSEEENWRKIYRILFPDCTVIPDPFYRIQYDDGIVQHSHLQKIFTHDNDSGINERFFSKLEEIAGASFDSAKRRAMLGFFETFAQEKLAETKEDHGPQHPGDDCTVSRKALRSSIMDKTSGADCVEDLTSSTPRDASVVSLVPETGTERVDDPQGSASRLATFDPIHEYDFTQALLDDQIRLSTPWQEVNLSWIEGGFDQLYSNPPNGYPDMATVQPCNNYTLNGESSVCNVAGKHTASNSARRGRQHER